MKTDIRNLRKQLDIYGITVYREGGNWILSQYIEIDRISRLSTMHWSIKTEREAIEIALNWAMENEAAEKVYQEFIEEMIDSHNL